MELVLSLFMIITIVAMAVAPLFMVIELFRVDQDGSFPWSVVLVIIVWFIGVFTMYRLQELLSWY